MCWRCGRVRPSDGPEELKLPGYNYLLPSGQIAVAREAADWEKLYQWPDWEATDSNGNPYFEMREIWPEVFVTAYQEAMFATTGWPNNIADRTEWARIYALSKEEFWEGEF